VLRLVVFDSTDTGPLAVPRIERDADGAAHGTGGLTRWWRLGALFHRGALRASDARGAANWSEALRWAVEVARKRGEPIAELQAWGHGGWGYMGMGKERLDKGSLEPGAALEPALRAFASALSPDALLWLRCCSAFGESGRGFAERLASFLGVRVAGHTHIIGVWQSGTHSAAPGQRADWPESEGVEALAAGPAMVRGQRPRLVAKLSSPDAPRTISCVRLALPAGW